MIVVAKVDIELPVEGECPWVRVECMVDTGPACPVPLPHLGLREACQQLCDISDALNRTEFVSVARIVKLPRNGQPLWTRLTRRRLLRTFSRSR